VLEAFTLFNFVSAALFSALADCAKSSYVAEVLSLIDAAN